MLRRLSIGLVASAIALAPLPTKAQDGTAEDLGVMSISLADVVKPTIGFQGALQGAGTPNQAGIGGFLPLSVGDNSVWFLDALVNAHFSAWPEVVLRVEPICVVTQQRVTLVAHQLRIRPAGRDLGLPEERGDVGVKLQLKCHCESDRASPWCERGACP